MDDDVFIASQDTCDPHSKELKKIVPGILGFAKNSAMISPHYGDPLALVYGLYGLARKRDPDAHTMGRCLWALGMLGDPRYETPLFQELYSNCQPSRR